MPRVTSGGPLVELRPASILFASSIRSVAYSAVASFKRVRACWLKPVRLSSGICISTDMKLNPFGRKHSINSVRNPHSPRDYTRPPERSISTAGTGVHLMEAGDGEGGDGLLAQARNARRWPRFRALATCLAALHPGAHSRYGPHSAARSRGLGRRNRRASLRPPAVDCEGDQSNDRSDSRNDYDGEDENRPDRGRAIVG